MEYLLILLLMMKFKMKIESIKPEFVEFIPEVLEPGVLYVSIPYATASHKCACGCGELVVTPIKPTDWELTWDGESVTMYPSIGNWSFSCQSHYFIKKNRIVWSYKMSKDEINFGRKMDKSRKEKFFKKTKNHKK